MEREEKKSVKDHIVDVEVRLYAAKIYEMSDDQAVRMLLPAAHYVLSEAKIAKTLVSRTQAIDACLAYHGMVALKRAEKDENFSDEEMELYFDLSFFSIVLVQITPDEAKEAVERSYEERKDLWATLNAVDKEFITSTNDWFCELVEAAEDTLKNRTLQ